MNPRKVRLGVAVLAASALLTSCATNQEQQDQATGAVVGCAGGALVGALLGGGRGAAIGCAAGAVVGWSSVALSQYQAAQARSYEADRAQYRKVDPDFYGLNQHTTAGAVKIRTVNSAPKTVNAGGSVTFNTDYSLIAPQNRGAVEVQEVLVLKKDGKVLSEMRAQTEQRQTGGWASQGAFPIPQGADKGYYVVEHRVQVGTSYDTKVSTFQVI